MRKFKKILLPVDLGEDSSWKEALPTAVDQALLRLRNVYQDRRSGKDRRMGVTYMDPEMDRRKGERRKNSL